MTFNSPKSAATAGLGAVGFVFLFVAIFALSWAIASGLTAIALNTIGGFGLSFAKVVGIGLLLAVVTSNSSK